MLAYRPISPKEPAMTREIFPRVGCGAVLLKNNALLLVHRKRDPESDHWGLPGGKVDPFETVPQAVVREIKEETGVHITHLRLLCLVDHIAPDHSAHWVAPVYLAEKFEGKPSVKEPNALAGVKWCPLNALPAKLTYATHIALKALYAQNIVAQA